MASTVKNEPDRNRYVILVDDIEAGEAAYRNHDGQTVIVHTEISPKFGGQGLGSTLIRFALDDLRSTGREVLPQCPFVRTFITKNPEYLDLVPAASRQRFGLPAA